MRRSDRRGRYPGRRYLGLDDAVAGGAPPAGANEAKLVRATQERECSRPQTGTGRDRRGCVAARGRVAVAVPGVSAFLAVSLAVVVQVPGEGDIDADVRAGDRDLLRPVPHKRQGGDERDSEEPRLPPQPPQRRAPV